MDKVLQGGSNSAAEFVQELIIHLQSAFSKFAIAHQATEMFAHQVAKRSEEAVGRISLPNDLAGGLSALGGVRGLPAPLLYQNFYVGQCRDLIFGVSLMVRPSRAPFCLPRSRAPRRATDVLRLLPLRAPAANSQDYAYARGISATDANRVPLIVAKCIAGVEARGLAAEGLYRISPRQSAVQTVRFPSGAALLEQCAGALTLTSPASLPRHPTAHPPDRNRRGRVRVLARRGDLHDRVDPQGPFPAHTIVRTHAPPAGPPC